MPKKKRVCMTESSDGNRRGGLGSRPHQQGHGKWAMVSALCFLGPSFPSEYIPT